MKSRKIQMDTIRKVLRYIKKYRVLLFISILLAASTVALTLYVPILIGNAIDYIVGPGNVNFEVVAKILVQIAFAVGITAIFEWFMYTINNNITYQVVRDIREKAFRKIEILPLSYIDSHPHGEIVSRVIADVEQFAEGLLMGFTQLFTGVVTIIATLIFMLTINIKITFIVVILTPLSLFVANFIAKHTYSMFKLQSETRGEQTSLIEEMIGNVKVVQAFSYQEEALKKFDEINERLEKYSLRAVFFSSLTNPLTRFINSLVYAAVALAGAIAVISGDVGSTMTVGGLSIFLSYASQYAKPFNEISGVITEMQNALACAGRVFELIEEKPQVPDADDAVTLKNASGNVVFDNVAFSYVPERPLIRNLNLEVKPGQRVAIVGPTGSGKTTVINLLMRFYDVDSGSIKVEGIDIRNITRQSLRENYGMVLQDTWLKSGTIRENITMGKPDATEEEIIAAAKAAHAHSFIKRLENGYDTVISEEGGSLSQGQKQLLSIARVMLCLPPMLILDEATSSIDTRTEVKIQEAFARLMQGRTSFVVAHRLSTIREADVILVMKDGDIIEQGTHEELLSKKGFYANLYNSQFAQ
ncbi:ATP-binding cassette subfamily B protein [Acetivibrio thermocellus AD2]|jgi:ATP-binding cassette subfamily B multidrug efflux pump|uniref:ATP-binding cassette subfamily B protein n=1 Tax=Acetivibrio thermocellus AD2 TaxID=1138384 RepID=A0AB36TH07_ACETH|nr:ABC transporter ATP-binding protein [Acetivibrio thermocellus]ADU74880.1 ABC transporter transmembrane region [Acetivibrio thermocellus DSM 1313]ALX08835.1 Xenobiotic-transporting ATPase [Acetivibrio thermocellus AD2]ANV76585.1 Xenobiotic-transporting ATPase [Acetivibrio thermocellus DSM 2360]EIC05176.1 ABC transporter related protein [Acetivibrio thermocellus YS]NLU25683.1 ABC transporter ATP-binding protein [Acetivibrio thermocellus]